MIMQDDGPCNTAEMVKQFFEAKNVEFMICKKIVYNDK